MTTHREHLKAYNVNDIVFLTANFNEINDVFFKIFHFSENFHIFEAKNLIHLLQEISRLFHKLKAT